MLYSPCVSCHLGPGASVAGTPTGTTPSLVAATVVKLHSCLQPSSLVKLRLLSPQM